MLEVINGCELLISLANDKYLVGFCTILMESFSFASIELHLDAKIRKFNNIQYLHKMHSTNATETNIFISEKVEQPDDEENQHKIHWFGKIESYNRIKWQNDKIHIEKIKMIFLSLLSPYQFAQIRETLERMPFSLNALDNVFSIDTM